MFGRYKYKKNIQAISYLKGSLLAFKNYHGHKWLKTTKKARSQFYKKQPLLSRNQTNIVKDLRKSGIAFTTLHDLFNDPNIIDELFKYEIENTHNYRKSKIKPFLKYLIGGDLETCTHIYEHDNPFYKLSLSATVLDIVNSYFNSWSRFIYQELNRTGELQEKPNGSQRWHRDPGMHGYLKMFIYLNDVDEGSGPFEYIPGTHYYGLDKSFPQKQFGQGGFYPPKDVIEKHYSESQIKQCVGPKGTVIFADTSGIHRGGRFSHGFRILSTSGFCQPNDRYKRKFNINNESIDSILTSSPELQFALNLDDNSMEKLNSEEE